MLISFSLYKEYEFFANTKFLINKSDGIPKYFVMKSVGSRWCSNLEHFEVSLSIQTDVFSEAFPILTSQALQPNSVLRTDVSLNCGQGAKLIFAIAGDMYFYGNGVRIESWEDAADGKESAGFRLQGGSVPVCQHQGKTAPATARTLQCSHCERTWELGCGSRCSTKPMKTTHGTMNPYRGGSHKFWY